MLKCSSFFSRYYPSPYPVTNRIMTVQPTMSPYMSPVSAYQVLHKIFDKNLANPPPPCLLSLYVTFRVTYTGMWVKLYFCLCVGGLYRCCRCKKKRHLIDWFQAVDKGIIGAKHCSCFEEDVPQKDPRRVWTSKNTKCSCNWPVVSPLSYWALHLMSVCLSLKGFGS